MYCCCVNSLYRFIQAKLSNVLFVCQQQVQLHSSDVILCIVGVSLTCFASFSIWTPPGKSWTPLEKVGTPGTCWNKPLINHCKTLKRVEDWKTLSSCFLAVGPGPPLAKIPWSGNDEQVWFHSSKTNLSYVGASWAGILSFRQYYLMYCWCVMSIYGINNALWFYLMLVPHEQVWFHASNIIICNGGASWVRIVSFRLYYLMYWWCLMIKHDFIQAILSRVLLVRHRQVWFHSGNSIVCIDGAL